MTVHDADLRRAAIRTVGATALNWIVLSLPAPARELVDLGVPGWTAYATCLSSRVESAFKALRSLRCP